MKTIATLFKDYKPLPFFSLMSVALLALALILCVPVLIEYSYTGLVPRFPTLIVSGFIAVFAMQAFVCGLILDTEVKKGKQSYEMQMNILEYVSRNKD